MDAVSSSGVAFAAQQPPHTPANAGLQQPPRHERVEPAQQPQPQSQGAASDQGQQATGGGNGNGNSIDVYA